MNKKYNSMKNLILIFTGLFCLISCNKIDDLLTFSISDETQFTVSSGLPINLPFEIATPDVTTNSSAEFSNNNTRADLVKDIRLTELKLTVINPTDKTFSFLKAVHLYISTNSNDEIELASLDNINTTSNNINLICSGSKLDQYVKAGNYKIRTQVTTKETLTQDIDVKVNMTFKVTADPL